MKQLKDYEYYRTENGVLYCGDNLEVLKKNVLHCENIDFVDLVITSPPYNLGNDHHTGNKKINPYDDNVIEAEY